MATEEVYKNQKISVLKTKMNTFVFEPCTNEEYEFITNDRRLILKRINILIRKHYDMLESITNANRQYTNFVLSKCLKKNVMILVSSINLK